MRIWKGIEREGKSKGILTLFIEASILCQDDIEKIDTIASKNDLKRLYFGAGRIDWEKESLSLVKKLCDKGYSVTIECSYSNYYNNKVLLNFKEIIVRIDTKIIPLPNVTVKLDNNKSVAMFYNPIYTSLATLKNGMYTDSDILILKK